MAQEHKSGDQTGLDPTDLADHCSESEFANLVIVRLSKRAVKGIGQTINGSQHFHRSRFGRCRALSSPTGSVSAR